MKKSPQKISSFVNKGQPEFDDQVQWTSLASQQG